MGDAPRWYYLVRAAQFYGCMPWDLVDQPVAYIDMALQVMSAEAHAEKMQKQVNADRGMLG
jgi:hypothetical protein